MDAKVMNLKGNAKKVALSLPPVFETPFRPDLIKRAVLSEQTFKKQPQGRYPLAGRLVAESGVGPGRGISKVPRTHGKGTHHGSRGTFIHSTRGGKLAFPPKVEKKITEKINKKEKRYALYSAVSSTADKDLVEKRGHQVDDVKAFPIIIDNKATQLVKSAEVIQVLEQIGLAEDLARCKPKKIRAGKGKYRGRKYRRKVGPLIVVKDDCKLMRAGRNIAGVDVMKVTDLNVEALAPGTNPGRAVVWTEEAIEVLKEWK